MWRVGASGQVGSIRLFQRRIFVRTIGSSIVGAAMLWLDMVVFYPVYPASEGLGRLLLMVAIVAVPYYVIAATIGATIVGRRFRAATHWVAQRRVPTDIELAELAAQPKRFANQGLYWWIGSYAWTMPYLYFVVGYRPGPLALAKITIAFALASMIAWTLTGITVGRVLRPLRALALSGDTRRFPRTMGVFPQLLLVWIVVSARPLIEAGGMLVGLDAVQLERVVPVIWGICFASAVAGMIVTALSARAITDPLEKLRHGLLAIERGQLGVELPVDEAGEIGSLQAGFNRMAAVLRERDRMLEVFGRHVGPDVARRALEGNDDLGGDMRDATALFVDVIGSSQLSETRTPGEVVTDLNTFFDVVVNIVGMHGGFVNKFEGDGALCVFGAPIDNEDHAKCALSAALALSDELSARLSDRGISAAIGVSSGLVVAGNVGALDRYEFTVIGDPVNEASRLTEEAKNRLSRVLVSGSTVEAAGLPAGWKSVGALQLRGRSYPTNAYEPASPYLDGFDQRLRVSTV
jgi:adenylate cyclase